MNRRLLPLLFAALLAMPVAGSAAEEIPPNIIAAFRSATRVILYSLDPADRHGGGGFYGFRIVGFTPVENAATLERVATTLQKHLNQGAGFGGALCFDPHHAIRFVIGRSILDLVICYECGHVYIYKNGASVREVGILGDRAYLDEILTAAKVPLTTGRH